MFKRFFIAIIEKIFSLSQSKEYRRPINKYDETQGIVFNDPYQRTDCDPKQIISQLEKDGLDFSFSAMRTGLNRKKGEDS